MNNKNEKIIAIYNEIQFLYSKLKIRMFMFSLYYKQLIIYYKKYNENITKNILNNKKLIMMLNRPIPVYRIKSNKNNNNNNTNLSPHIIKLTEKEYYKLRAFKLILEYLLIYDKTIQMHLKKWREYFYNNVEMQKNIYQTFIYSLDLIYTNGRMKNQYFTDNLQEILNDLYF